LAIEYSTPSLAVDGKSIASWLFVVQACAKAQNFCFNVAKKETLPLVFSHIEFVRREGLPVARENNLRRVKENLDRDGISQDIDIV
jgi:hypothetical protein